MGRDSLHRPLALGREREAPPALRADQLALSIRRSHHVDRLWRPLGLGMKAIAMMVPSPMAGAA